MNAVGSAQSSKLHRTNFPGQTINLNISKRPQRFDLQNGAAKLFLTLGSQNISGAPTNAVLFQGSNKDFCLAIFGVGVVKLPEGKTIVGRFPEEHPADNYIKLPNTSEHNLVSGQHLTININKDGTVTLNESRQTSYGTACQIVEIESVPNLPQNEALSEAKLSAEDILIPESWLGQKSCAFNLNNTTYTISNSPMGPIIGSGLGHEARNTPIGEEPKHSFKGVTAHRNGGMIIVRPTITNEPPSPAPIRSIPQPPIAKAAPTPPLSIESLRATPNPFDLEKARGLIPIIKRFLNRESGMYYLLTGKATANISNEAAMQWLSSSGGKNWLSAMKEFCPVSVSVHRIIYLQNWWRFSTRPIKESKEDQIQQDCKIYLTPQDENVVSTFLALKNLLEASPELNKAGFEIKMLNLDERLSEVKLSMNQNDRIVIYASKEHINLALPIVQRYLEEHRGILKREGVPFAQPMVGRNGEIFSGACVTEQPSNKHSFFSTQAEIIEKCVQQISSNVDRSVQDSPLTATQKLQRVLSQQDGEKFVAQALVHLYPNVASSFGIQSDNISFQS
ncbi:MAG: hypothetical protein ABIH69_03755 [bacterium]|nr:hypothetical protein [Candidatus Margulisiibacteriota bacterium]